MSDRLPKKLVAFKTGHVASGNWRWALTHQPERVNDPHLTPAVLVSVNPSACWARGGGSQVIDDELLAKLMANLWNNYIADREAALKEIADE